MFENALHLSLLFITISVAAPHVSQHAEIEASMLTICLSTESVKNTLSAAEITLAAKQCADDRHYRQAAELLVIANAYGFYDRQRIIDKSNDDTLDTLFSTELGSLKKYQQTNLTFSHQFS